ncbi:UDP-glucosyltransferase 2-like isoform X1 [Eupeodes corollae]|uniref:UDP-glucosyltransferase 2-like isoform X1 n=2 Tax=Eupeodes corollae TaxID=290404 RepID=UPI0024918294|nr:UDP-glucosyltransferase 2-like isoform X1 [Eupeodes corollae]
MHQKMNPPHTIMKLLILFFTLCLSNINAYNILGLFPHPGVSHFHFFHPIMRALAEAGHDVTVISHFPDKSPPAHYKDLVLTGVETLSNSINLQLFENRPIYSHFLEFFLLHEWGKEACNHTIKSPALAQVLKHKNRYDVIIMEQFNTDCLMGVAHVLKAPVIALSSCALMPWHYERFGNPIIPSYIPALFMGQAEKMDFLSRVGNWISFHGLNFLYNHYSHKTATELIRRKFGHDMPSTEELVKETSLVFVNQHYALSGSKPLSPSVIELGGVHIQKARPLDADVQRYLDNATDGVVLISWGSMIKADTLPAAKRDGIVKALKRLKQKVVWKWENDTLAQQPPNVLVMKWLPQREILCHPNVKVFMTHAGLMGSTEAAYCGVPVVATPMYGDQFLNAAALAHRGMGTILKYEDITEATVVKAIRLVLEKPFLDNAKKVSYAFRNRPRTAKETAVWWVEHVIKTRGAPLTKSVSRHMSRFVYYSLDVYTLFASVILISLLTWIWLMVKICSLKKQQEKIKSS